VGIEKNNNKNQMKIVEFKRKILKSFKNYYILEGFPSPDLIATITTKYLIDKLKMKKIGYLESKSFFPVIRITDGLPEHPIRIYASEKFKLIAILPDQIIPNEHIFEYSKTILDWAKRNKIKGILTINAINSVKKQLDVFGATNNLQGLEFLKNHKIKIIHEGITSGIAAQLFMLEHKLPIYLLLGTKTSTSYEVAARILEKLNLMFNTNINTKPLLEQSKKILTQVKKQLNKIEDNKDNGKQIMYS